MEESDETTMVVRYRGFLIEVSLVEEDEWASDDERLGSDLPLPFSSEYDWMRLEFLDLHRVPERSINQLFII